MASNYNRKSVSSGSRKASPRNSRASGQAGRGVRPAGGAPRQSARGGMPRTSSRVDLTWNLSRHSRRPAAAASCEPGSPAVVVGARGGSATAAERSSRAQKSYRLLPGAHRHRGRARAGARRRRPGACTTRTRSPSRTSRSPAWEHLTATDMSELASVPAGATLPRVDRPLASASACSRDGMGGRRVGEPRVPEHPGAWPSPSARSRRWVDVAH